MNELFYLINQNPFGSFLIIVIILFMLYVIIMSIIGAFKGPSIISHCEHCSCDVEEDDDDYNQFDH